MRLNYDKADKADKAYDVSCDVMKSADSC